MICEENTEKFSKLCRIRGHFIIDKNTSGISYIFNSIYADYVNANFKYDTAFPQKLNIFWDMYSIEEVLAAI